MAYYLVRAKVAQDFMKALVERPEDRLVTTTRLLQGIGGRLHYYFFCFGEYDIVLIYELPDNVSSASLSMVLTSSGTVTEVETTPLSDHGGSHHRHEPGRRRHGYLSAAGADRKNPDPLIPRDRSRFESAGGRSLGRSGPPTCDASGPSSPGSRRRSRCASCRLLARKSSPRRRRGRVPARHRSGHLRRPEAPHAPRNPA